MFVRRLLRGAAAAAVLVLAASQAGAQCSLTGPTSLCQGDSITLCSSGGAWQWTGPGGFTATTKCITVTQPGTYSVRVYDALNGFWFGPCTAVVTQTPPDSCHVATPPTAAYDSTNCPRGADFWARQLRTRRGSPAAFGPSTMQALVADVDARSAYFNWPDSVAGFARALAGDWRRDWEGQAATEYVAVLANLAARDAQLALTGEGHIGLDPAAAFVVHGLHGTVGAWAAATDSQLIALRGVHGHDRAVREAYDRIADVGWALTFGLGMRTTCGDSAHSRRCDRRVVTGALDGPAATLTASNDLAFAAPSPNPFRESTGVSWAVSDASGSSVEIGVFDLAGRRVATLANGFYGPGSYGAVWDGRDAGGAPSHAGVYFVRGRIGAATFARSVVRVP